MRELPALASIGAKRARTAPNTAVMAVGNDGHGAKKHNPQKLAFLRIAFVWSGVCVDAVGAALQSEKGSYEIRQ